MENNDFKIRIIDFYKDVDKPIINNLYEDNLGKNILKLNVKIIMNFVDFMKIVYINMKIYHMISIGKYILN